jgi:hypothetical protein
MKNKEILAAAQLTSEEVANVNKFIEHGDKLWEFYDSSAFMKLYEYFIDIEEMPYSVAKGRTEAPDDWILNRLS